MVWTYDLTRLASSALYQIRFELQDTDATEQLLQDEEILHLIVIESSFLGACARGAEIIARLFARQADTVQNPTVKLQFKSRVTAYHSLAHTLRRRASGVRIPVMVSGSKSAKDAALANVDRSGPTFRRGMHDRFPNEDGVGGGGFASGDDPIFRSTP